MSWLTGGLTQSVTGKLSQITGQFKDILSEGTEDVVDPDTELKVLNEKLKENEKRFELLKMESDRWQEESNEFNLKCKTYEAQLEQRNNEYRSQLMQKDSQINELRKQISNLQDNKNETSFHLDTSSSYQKSALMEEFEELMPSSDLNDYIHFQKEIKRLNEDNMHLSNENKQLLHKLKTFESNKSDDIGPEGYLNEHLKQEYEITIENLKHEIFVLKERLNTDKDKHQEEIIAIQNNYASKVDKQLKEKQNEIEISRIKLEEMQAKLDEKQKELDEIKSNSSSEPTASKIFSNKSDDGWCLNGDEVHFESGEKIEIKNLKAKLSEKENELTKLQQQVDMFENDLEQANNLILRLKNMNKSKSPTPSKSSDQEEMIEFIRLKHNDELDRLNHQINDLNSQLNNLNEILTNEREKNEKQLKELEAQDKQIDSLNLELKQQQQNLQQEKIIQMQEQKQDRQEMAKLKIENNELKLKLDEKLAEIKSLGDQINIFNKNINDLKSNDSVLFDELKLKTEEFMKQLNFAETEIAALKNEKDQLIEQRKQFEFVLDEKTRESSQLKNDIQKHLQHISAQSKAIEKLHEELKSIESKTEIPKEDEENYKKTQEEFSLLKQQYNEIYTYLEQKNQESLSYYNEIQRLNGALSTITSELENAKSVNENLNEQYDNLMKECQMEQKIVEDLNQQIDELNKTFMNAHNIQQKQSRQSSRAHSPIKVTCDNETQTDIITEHPVTTINKTDDELVVKKEISETDENQHDSEDIVKLTKEFETFKQTQEELFRESQQYYENQLSQLKKENEDLLNQMKSKLNDSTNYYENIINEQNENFKQTLLNEEQLQMNLSKELSDLRSHLAEMTDNYNREMIQAEEREKQLRLDLNNLDDILRKQNENIELSNSELETFKTNNSKLDEMKNYYENKIATEIHNYKQQLMNEEQQQVRLKKELERLREHLVEMSDSYNKDAIQAEEREKQLRLALNEAQQTLQKQDVNLENSSKELEYKLESLNQINLDIKNEKDKLKDKLKQTEENLNHQVKVTKNLELVLERLQNDKESLHSTEILKYQQTIKDQANSIYNLQKESQTYQAQIENLKNSLDSANIFMEELDKKDEILKQFQAQIATKDALIESLDKRVNDIQKVNDSFIEKEMIKNLVIGYIKVNQQHEKKQVLKLISTMLSFSPKEIELVESAGESKWFTNLLKPTSTPTKQSGPNLTASSGAEGLNKSFTELLIQYVDRESKPKPNIQFDINDPNISHKKTDTASLASSKELANTSASAINFFNKSMVSQTGVNDSIADNLVNRNQPQQSLSSNNQTIPGVSSPAVANNFLEQILKS